MRPRVSIVDFDSGKFVEIVGGSSVEISDRRCRSLWDEARHQWTTRAYIECGRRMMANDGSIFCSNERHVSS